MALKINGITVVDDNRIATFTGLQTTVQPTQFSSSSTDPTVLITQIGLGPAFTVQTALNDASPFQVNNSGQVGIQGVPSGTYDLEVFGTGHFTSDITVEGNLIVNGTTTTVNSATLTVDDKNIELGSITSPTDITADGGGITLRGSTDKTLLWANSTGRWAFNTGVDISGALSFVGNLTGTGTSVVNIGSGQFYKSSDGKVGIGTTGPTVKFVVVGTDAIKIPAGTSSDRPVGEQALLRFNTTTKKYEGHDGASWVSVGGGATGTGSDAVFIENDTTVTQSYTITAGKNAGTFGPITILNGISVTIPTGSVWTVL